MRKYSRHHAASSRKSHTYSLVFCVLVGITYTLIPPPRPTPHTHLYTSTLPKPVPPTTNASTACPTAHDLHNFAQACSTLYRKPGPDFLCKSRADSLSSPWLAQVPHPAWDLSSTALACPDFLHIPAAPKRFRNREFQCYSQNTEDGILLHLLLAFGAPTRRGIEIAGGIGWENNLVNLAVNFGFDILFFDGDAGNAKCARNFLQAHPATAARFDRGVWWSSDFVTRESFNHLIANLTGWSGDIDVLSIDIDGMDYWLWDCLDVVRPRIVVVEIQELWGPDLRRTRPYNPKHIASGADAIAQMGASLGAFRELARRRGYRLAGCIALGFNAFFVRDDLPGVESVLGGLDYNATGCFAHVDAAWRAVLDRRRTQAERYTWVDPL